MKAKLTIEVRPFDVPNCVYLIAQQGDATSATVLLSALDESTLDSMCNQYREQVFKKAAKTDPRLKE